MSTSGPIAAARRIFSFPVMIAGLLTMLSVLSVRSRFDDLDLWWHLKTGQIIWTTHSIPTSDLFSYTTNHHAYVPHEWLAQILIFAAYKLAGYSGLMGWLCFFAAAQLIAGYILCWLYSGNPKIASLGALTIWFFATVGYSIRPQMIGYLILIVELSLLYLGRTRSPRWFLGLPPLFAVWVNCHGSFFLGIMVAGSLLFSSYFDFQSGSLTATRWDAHRRNLLILTFSLSLLALWMNPIGINQIFYPLNTLLHQPVVLSEVSEWQPLQFGDVRSLAVLAIPWGIFLLAIIRRTELFLHEVLWLALATGLAISHRRLLFAFGILIAPILSRVLANVWDGYREDRDRPLANAVLIALSLLVVFWTFPGPQNLQTQVLKQSPVRAVDFIKTHHLSGPMVNEWDDGGYLIWAAPEHPVFIDGRADVFQWAGVIEEYRDWATLRSPPSDLLDKYHVGFCLLSQNSPLVRMLPLMPDWKAVYSDDMSVIFVRDSMQHPAH